MRQTHYKKIAFTVVCLIIGITQLHATINITKLWESTADMPAGTDAKQGVGYDGTIYIQDKAALKIYAFAKVGETVTRSEYAASDVGSGFAVDDAGNLACRVGYFASATPNALKIYKKGSTTATDITFALPTPGRCDYNSASGDFFSAEGGYVWFLCDGTTSVQYVKICNGGATPADVTVGTMGGVLPGAANTTSHIVTGTATTWFGQTRSADFYMWNGTEILAATPDGAKKSTLGGCAFTIGGKLVYAYNSGATHYNSEFKVRNMTDGEDIATELMIGDGSATNTAYANWLTASKIDDNTYYLHQYCPQVGVALWKVAATITPPSITANAASGITTSAATLNASFTQGTKTITARGFRYGTSSGNYPFSCSGTVSGTNFSADITGLTANTTYYYQAYVTTADGTVYSNEKSFTTSPIPPTVTTNDATNVLATTATLNASFTQGSKPITARGFNYGTTSGSYTEHISGTVSGTNFFANITGLTAYTTYYYKAYVTTADGTVYGDEISFTTLAVPPTVTTEDATSVQTTTATLNASFTQGSKPITARGFNYGTTSGSYTLSADGAVSGSTFSANITGLTANTTYYYKAYVTTDDGTVYGNEKSFKTNLGAIVIAANESKPIANNYVGDIVIHHGGQISNDTAFSFTGQIRYKRTFNTPIVWHTCCFPFAIDHVTVEEDGVEYTIVPYYQGAPAHSCHFWIKTLDRDPSNPELYQRWTTPTTSTIKKDTAYIIIFPKITDSTSYYDNKVVTFYSTNGNHTINNTDMPVSTYEYTGNGFYFYANLSLRNQSFSGTEFYRLDRTPYTGNFELHENPIIVPSECFIQASDEFKQKSTSIFLPKSTEDSGVYTGLPPTLDTKTTPLLVINSINGIELLSHTAQTIAVYTTNGLKVAACNLSAGELHTISLPKGIYIIVSDQSPLPLKVIN